MVPGIARTKKRGFNPIIVVGKSAYSEGVESSISNATERFKNPLFRSSNLWSEINRLWETVIPEEFL